MYNVERFLREAIESILAQTFRDFEFIIFDDGSTDNSVAIAESYNDPRIRLFRSPHVGRAAALNKAIDYSTTELLAFMDADDISMKTRFEEQLKYLSENPSVGVISSWAERIDENGKHICVLKYSQYHDEIEYKMTARCSVMFAGSIIKKMFILNIKGFDELIVASSDYEIMLRLLPITQFYTIPKSLYMYRRNVSSISSRYSDLQNTTQLNKGKEYLLKILNQNLSIRDEYTVFRRMGICEYYHFSMKAARRYLFKAILFGDLSIQNFRYFIPTFFGDKLFSIYRNQLRIKSKY